MYVPKIFLPPNSRAAKQFISENGFATLVSEVNGFIEAGHTPLFLHDYKGEESLLGHFSIANPLCQAIRDGKTFLAIFMEQHAYISSSWYNHVNVPTWNYIAIHVSGTPHELNTELTDNFLSQLTDKYESPSEKPFKVEHMDVSDYRRQKRGIMAFAISIDKIEASFKLSQNRSEEDYNNIITELRKRGDHFSLAIAEEMESIIKG